MKGECCAMKNEGCGGLDVSCGEGVGTGCRGWRWGGGGGVRELKVYRGLGQGKELRFAPSPINQNCPVLQNQTFFGPNEQLSKSIYI